MGDGNVSLWYYVRCTLKQSQEVVWDKELVLENDPGKLDVTVNYWYKCGKCSDLEFLGFYLNQENVSEDFTVIITDFESVKSYQLCQ